MSQTYLAEDLDLPASPKPICVVKHIRPQMISPELTRLFQKEAEILYKLGHKHDQIPKLFAYFEWEHRFYLIQEFIDGYDLSAEIRPGAPWSEGEVVEFLHEILSVLAFVHRDRVIHRDIKPQNIMRRRDGRLVPIDFGVAKEVGALGSAGTPLPSRTLAVGTPGYMPGEQAIGKPKFSSDVYAVGITAIQALTGRSPEEFSEGEDGELQWQEGVVASLPLMRVLAQMVRYDFRQRYPNAAVALASLQAACSGTFVLASQLLKMPSSEVDVSEGLVATQRDGRYGFSDRWGRTVISPQFDGVGDFVGDLAPVFLDGWWGYISRTGQIEIAPQFRRGENFAEGLAAVQVGENWGYLDGEGRLAIAPCFEQAWSFAEGLAPVRWGQRWGFIDPEGHWAIEPQYEEVSGFSQGLAAVRVGESWGYLDCRGKIIITPQFDAASVFAEGLAAVGKEGLFGYIDRTGVMAIAPQFAAAWRFCEGMAAVRRDELYGYLDRQGSWVIPAQFEWADDFCQGSAWVEQQGRGFYIDRSGEPLDERGRATKVLN